MRALVVVLLAIAMLGSACDSSEPLPPGVTTTTTRPPPEPPPTPQEVQEVDDCDDLVDVGILFAENMIQALERGMTVSQLTGEEAPPSDVSLLREVGVEMDRRAIRLECDVAALNGAIVADISNIETTDPVVALFLDIVRAGIVTDPSSSSTTAP